MKNSFPKNFQDIKAANAKLNFSANDEVQRPNWITTKIKKKKEIHSCKKTKMKFQTLCTDTAEAAH